MSTEIQPSTELTEKDIFQQLEKLERAINVPIVSGEVTAWLEAVTKAVKKTEAISCAYYHSVHPELFQQITELDPEQNPRVQKLEEEDEEICACLHDVAEFAQKLRGAGNQVEPNERLISNATKELSDRIIAIVLRIRKHETEISTWHVEAMLRDRGAGD